MKTYKLPKVISRGDLIERIKRDCPTMKENNFRGISNFDLVIIYYSYAGVEEDDQTRVGKSIKVSS